MTKEGKKNTALYRDKYNYILSQREVQNKRGEFETTRSLGREKEQGSFLGRAERAKEGNEIVHGISSKSSCIIYETISSKRYFQNILRGTRSQRVIIVKPKLIFKTHSPDRQTTHSSIEIE